MLSSRPSHTLSSAEGDGVLATGRTVGREEPEKAKIEWAASLPGDEWEQLRELPWDLLQLYPPRKGLTQLFKKCFMSLT